jgi:hypothetical protein
VRLGTEGEEEGGGRSGEATPVSVAAATALLFGVRSNCRPLLLGIAFAAPLRVDKGGSIVVRVWAADGSVAVRAGGGQAAPHNVGDAVAAAHARHDQGGHGGRAPEEQGGGDEGGDVVEGAAEQFPAGGK